MTSFRNYFSIICLTKYEPILKMNNSNMDSSIMINYPNKIAYSYLYAIGGKRTNIVMKTVEKYDVERD